MAGYIGAGPGRRKGGRRTADNTAAANNVASSDSADLLSILRHGWIWRINLASKSDLPSFAEYFWPAIEAMKAKGGSVTIEEMEEGVANRMAISEELRAIPHGDGPRTQFQYELAWVRTYLKKAGAAENSERGVWSLTDFGEQLTRNQAEQIPNQVRAGEQSRRKLKPSSSKEDLIVAEEAVEIWTDLLLTQLLVMKADSFERLGQRLLRESGFTRVEVTGRSGDGGIDGIGTLRVNLVSFHVLFQCKRWKGGVGAKEVRDFRGAMIGRADKGLIITTGHFTADARKEATRDGAPAIDLVDGDALCLLLKDLKLGLQVKQVEEVTVINDFFKAI
jgi:restriction system protein